MNFNQTIYLITDREGLSEEIFLYKIEEACKYGVSMVQIREKQDFDRNILELGFKIKNITDKYNVPLIVDDRLDIAMALDCAGVHLGQEDLPIKHARKILGQKKIIGATAKTINQALEAENQGADYLGVGAIYKTNTKVNTKITEIEVLEDICKTVKIPVFAIGGLNEKNICNLKNTSISGICVVSAIMKSQDIENTMKKLKSFSNIVSKQ